MTTGKTKATKKMVSKTTRASASKPKGTKGSAPVRAPARREDAAAGRQVAFPVEVVEVASLDVVAVREPSTTSYYKATHDTVQRYGLTAEAQVFPVRSSSASRWNRCNTWWMTGASITPASTRNTTPANRA